MSQYNEYLIYVRGGGDLATGTIYRLIRSGFSVIILETERPSAIRRCAAFSEAVYRGDWIVEGMRCTRVETLTDALKVCHEKRPAILVDPHASIIHERKPWALVDAILAKRNLGTSRDMADKTVALGPGFKAGTDADVVIETQRGHNLGRLIFDGQATPDTGIPGDIAGHGQDRVVRATSSGFFFAAAQIGDWVKRGQTIGWVAADSQAQSPQTDESASAFSINNSPERTPVITGLEGVLRGILPNAFPVTTGYKAADVDPRPESRAYCALISDKARNIAGGVLEALLYLDGKPEGSR